MSLRSRMWRTARKIPSFLWDAGSDGLGAYILFTFPTCVSVWLVGVVGVWPAVVFALMFWVGLYLGIRVEAEWAEQTERDKQIEAIKNASMVIPPGTVEVESVDHDKETGLVSIGMKYTPPTSCEPCGGTGIWYGPEGPAHCLLCDGTGYTIKGKPPLGTIPPAETRPRVMCAECKGRGDNYRSVSDIPMTCKRCGGTGWTE